MALVSMKQTPEEATEGSPCAAPAPGEAPLYPYGTRLTLGDDELKKLGIALPAVGASFMLMARVEVVSARADKVQDGEAEIGADLQITDMELQPEGAQSDAATKLWPDAD